MPEALVVDASAIVDFLVGSPLGTKVAERLSGSELHAPAHFDAEVLSAVGRLHRAGDLAASPASDRIDLMAEAPIERHLLGTLLRGAWLLRHNLSLMDALYVELAAQLGASLVTTDAGLVRATDAAELIS
jgi:predicted nucleic acid-binding protein